MKQIKASEVEKGDRIELDVGYGPRSDEMFLTVLDVGYPSSLWDEGIQHISFYVSYHNGNFWTHDFKPEDKITKQ